MMKRNFKRVISALVSLGLCFGSFSLPASAQTNVDGECTINDYTMTSESEYALSYLEMLGILNCQSSDTVVTRGMAISAIVRAMGLEDVALGAGSMYTYDEKMALTAHRSGIISGNAPSEWDLDSPVTVAQLSKMLVVALGYGAVITSENAYPAEYLSYASKLGLMAGASSFDGDTVTIGDFAVMLSNAMEAEIMEITGAYAYDVKYEITDDKTLESIYLDIKDMVKGEGMVESDFYTSVVKDSKCDYSRIRIDGVIYTCESEKLMGNVGLNVEFVYSNGKTEATRKILGMRAADTNIVYEFESGHNAYFKDGVLYYEASGDKEGKINVSSDSIYIVNNNLLSSYNPDDVDYIEYSVKLIDNDDNNKCDIVFLTKSESMIVNYVKDGMIYLTYGTLNSRNVIDLTDLDEKEDSLIIRDVSGTPKTLEDIKEDMSISAIASDDFKYIEIIILPEEQTGKIEEYNSSDETVKVGGTVYGLKISSDEFTIGNTYTFRINENNEIFYIESIMSDCSYIVDVSNKSQGLSDGVKIKIYDNENGIQIFSAADKVNVDGTTYSDNASIYGAIEKGTLAYVSLNSQNEIKKIDYLDAYGENAKRVYRKYASGFNDIDKAESMPFRFDESTVFFYIPESGADADFGNLIPLENEDEYTTRAYELNEDTGFVKAVIVELDTDMRSDNYLTYKSDVGIVSSVKQVLDSEGQGVYKVEGFIDGAPFAYTSGHYDDVFSVCSVLKSGDVIRYITNYNNEIVRIQKIISLEDADGFFHDGKDTIDEQFFGQAITITKNTLTNFSEYLCHEMNVSTTLSYNNLAFMRFYADLVNPRDSSCQFSNYYCYDKKTEKVTVASVDDIITYEMAGDAASKVFVQRSKSDVQCIVIVKD